MTRTLFIAAIVTLTATPSFAGGVWQVGTDSFHIQTSDLDLSTPAGRAEALARVEKAAARLCRSSNLERDRAACEADLITAATRGRAGAPIRAALAERAQAAWAMARAK